MASSVYRTLCSLFNKYCLCLAIYMCEPWEKVILLSHVNKCELLHNLQTLVIF
uniref:Hypotheticial protein n=1 Tax=Schistosoma japonicum TaxID=6182 RepID=C1LFT3_SCHJA|nr:hypotheticial protein [Schistosoma japonicum]